jgi:tetratricopeptide (TPR) repeat protein
MTKLLKLSFFSGIFLGAGLAAGLVFLTMASDREGGGDPFHRELRTYDALAAAPAGGENPERLSRRLDRLEKQAQSVESLLSVLKRRRALARQDPGLIPAYREAARRAARAFPHSEPLSALAAAAILYRGAVDGETEAELRNYLVPVSQTRLSPLALGIRVLLGDMASPEKAAASSVAELLSTALPLIRGDTEERESLTADLAILRVLENSQREAAAAVQGILSENGPHSEDFLRFAAEYHYDFGDPLRTAEIYSRFETAEAMVRAADALVLAGYGEAARNLWRILTAPDPDGAASPSPEIKARSLYNLAASAGGEQEAAALFERLFREGSAGDPHRGAALIRYTRLLDTPRSLAILEDSPGGAGESRNTADPLLDLELLRRRRQIWTVDRIIAETWLLLGRHSGEERLYQWGAWFFNYQRRYDETAMLLKTAALHHFEGPWIPLAQAVERIAGGYPDEGEAILRSVSAEGTDRQAVAWQAEANLGRILESRRAPAEALEWYERAAGRAGPGKEAARLQVRIALCLKNLGRPQDSRRALEYALDLDPGSLNALMELRRLEGQKNTRERTKIP